MTDGTYHRERLLLMVTALCCPLLRVAQEFKRLRCANPSEGNKGFAIGLGLSLGR